MADTAQRQKIKIMGIINATPDSFYAPSRYNMRILDSGADIIDIGACSTRPGSTPVGEEEEWARLKPILRSLPTSHPALSIDTFRPEIVRRAFETVGPFIVNDVSGAADSTMLPLVRQLGLRYIAMHSSGAADVRGVISWFDTFSRRLEGLNWILDPGFGFGKTIEENWELLRQLDRFSIFGREVLVGVSRKRMTGGSAVLTRKAHLEAISRGAGILRVHDVEDARKTIEEYYSSR